MANWTRKGLFVLLGVAALAGTAIGVAFDRLSGSAVRTSAEVPEVRIELDRTELDAKAWRFDGSHLALVKGRLTMGDKPVSNAEVQADSNGRRIRTDDDGAFKLSVDRSLIAKKTIRVVSAQEATIAGKPVGDRQAAALLAASSPAISIYHPIEVTRVEPSADNPDQVKVFARFKIGEGDQISYFRADKYRVSGQVADADGNPVKDAIVWIDRDEGEGFAKSTPTGSDGSYEMYYWPEDETANLTVIVGTRKYELPEGKMLKLPQKTSVDIKIRLPKEGTTLDDQPPSLVCTTAKGATYTGLLAGLDVPPATPYTVTIPDSDGRFVLTVGKTTWEQQPRFFETRYTKFIGEEKLLKGGDALPVGFVLAQDKDPRVTASAS
ncbi:hypothetical protein [Cohnella fermenti]|uniref:Carboxypeptidase regulatory-like domain-containing protein n=1 Tax=Cohnella fermenti TaxID=2565925 RepID=A0A4S4BPV4_9BACL|nr:hypothetical protein [Cohnella fermenti]THF74623.1 hypothetical protein E6C55_24820 [Cohnella fermenti]